MVELRPLTIPGVYEILPKKFGDHRGFFSETWNQAALGEAGLESDFVQDNHSYSAAEGVLRGLHLQLGSYAQDKLVRVVHGTVWDVAVDMRPSSPTLGQWVALELSRERWNQIFVPKGFAHGFVTTGPDAEVLYKVSTPYAPEWEISISYDDPALAIEWPIESSAVQLSAKDQAGISFAEALALVREHG